MSKDPEKIRSGVVCEVWRGFFRTRRVNYSEPSGHVSQNHAFGERK